MRAQQAKCSVEIAREIQNDKSLKSKAEKDRRLREKHSNNTKIFIDERRTAAMRQEKRKEKLRKVHDNQMNDLQIYMQSVRTCIDGHDAMYVIDTDDSVFLTLEEQSINWLSWEQQGS